VKNGFTLGFHHPAGGAIDGALRIRVPAPSPRDFPITPRSNPVTPRPRPANTGGAKGGGGMLDFQFKDADRDLKERPGLSTDLTIPNWSQCLRIEGEDIAGTSTQEYQDAPTAARAMQTPRTGPLKTPRPYSVQSTPQQLQQLQQLDSFGFLRVQPEETQMQQPAMTPRYDSSLGYYAPVDQNNQRLRVAESPRVPNSPRVNPVRGVARVCPRVTNTTRTMDSLAIEWVLPSKPFINGMFLCIDDGRNGPYTACHFWSPQDLRQHMRENGRAPVSRVITNLKGATKYRICLCEGDSDGQPMLPQTHAAATKDAQYFSTTGVKKQKPQERWNLPRWKPKWKPSPEWQADFQPEHVQSPRYRFSSKRYGNPPQQ